MKNKLAILFVISLLGYLSAWANEHPSLMLTKSGVKEIRQNLEGNTLFHKSLASTKKNMEKVLLNKIEVPLPVDPGGGYTHERHKNNYTEMQQMGILYQIYQDDKYATFVKNMLLEYAKMYPTLPLHPVEKSKYRGKLFWQGLNESVWLVHVSQAYDCIYDFLSPKDRKHIEENLFYPMVKFLSEENEPTFNKIHNHGTWSVSAVGMIGYAMGDKDLVEKSLYGLYKDGNGGFMRQLDQLFSPDGYFTEGPYYQRYALQPFITFAQVIENNEPERKIFKHRDGVLLKAVTTLLQLADSDGALFMLNDALYKTWRNTEIVYGVDIVYNITRDKSLLSIAQDQNKVILSDAGMIIARDLAKAKAKKEIVPFEQKTILVSDGAEGNEGAIGVLRMSNKNNQLTALMKATSHGMTHGHFDRLGFVLFNYGETVLQDYGAARYVNIETKNGGHYLLENDTWAKQSIAHNVLVVDEKSHFDGKIKLAEKSAPKILEFTEKENYKEIVAEENNAYSDVKMKRQLIMINDKSLKEPLIIDILNAESPTEHQYDLPFYYLGQLMSVNFEYTPYTTTREPLGEKNGYEFLWKEAMGQTQKGLASITFLNNSKFYTLSTLASNNAEIHLVRIGANDPNFNLRNEPAFILRERATNKTFLSVIETHGSFKADQESTTGSHSSVIEIGFQDAEKIIVSIKLKSGKTILINTKTKSITSK